ncbi:hypothetical protein ceV_206 [Chrysochromulina ericina virus CeV-01B]|jgi:hypothetical protein|uniref:Uncharacterized protein n=1 Tax=Chrysochromulina ericina virus CeV-01B TaxID=3070830 RepID=A0A0N9QJ22_9VIRU|nr:hypothetical protein ceV_206 [Chrysochromulina ericina virus]ALH23112.1 hypothetical protein ceV_206 [Chrysochromulina ericina virus CeV-01B]|tara:strand:- start:10084 stop:10479 length:396 start_codon:yes stop_codon:yes gene_type:complete
MTTFFNSKIENNSIIFTILKSSPNREEWDSTKQNILEWYQYLENNNIRAGLIFNLEELVYINPSYLLEWKQLFIDNREKTKRYIIASSIIIENSIVRQVINLFFKAYDPMRPTRIVKNIEEGKYFINENSN